MRFALLLSLFLPAATLAAQTAAPVKRAAATITREDVARRIGVIADDSMGGRDTPSRGLELTAQYVADQFRRFGLRPGGEDGSWFQRYPITRHRLTDAASRVVFSAGSDSAAAQFGVTARYLFGPIPADPVDAPAILLEGSGPDRPENGLGVKGKIVLVTLTPAEAKGSWAQETVRGLYREGPKAVVLLVDEDSAAFAKRADERTADRTMIGHSERPMVLEVRTDVVAGALRAAGADPTAARTVGPLGVRPLDSLSIRFDLRDSTLSAATAPNTVGILRGSDPKLRHQYVVFSAHMDHIGITSYRADSVNNGADDDASGTAGVVELAEAFSRPGARPRRSLIFLTVSGEEKGLWGSRHFVEHPPVPIDSIVADINMDMIGRNWADTIVAIGRQHSDLGATLARVNRAHPELHMAAVDDRWPEERFYFRSDHYNFAHKGVPILFFFNGVHPDYHQVTDSPDKINAEKEARVLRLVFYLGQAVANAERRPQWNPESRREIVERP